MISKPFVSLISLILTFTATLAEAKTCFNPKSECIEPGGTKYFEGMPVTLDCWRYKITYECKEDADNNCEPLRNQGCSFSTAKCKKMWGPRCGVQEVTYDCAVNKCGNEELLHNKHNTFCVTGDCVDQTRGKDGDMKQTVAALSAAAEAAKHINVDDPNNPKIFKGKGRECSKNIASGITKNCCGITPSGFLEGKILECADDERELAQAKDTGRTIYLGEYCHNKVLGVCTSHHQTYCVYQSKLARIIQAAANKQLGINNLGSTEHAICRELTMDEFRAIDFAEVDFSEFFQDIMNKISGSEVNNPEGVKDRAKKAAAEFKQQSDTYKGNIKRMRDKMQSKMRTVPEKTEPLTEKAIETREQEKKAGWT